MRIITAHPKRTDVLSEVLVYGSFVLIEYQSVADAPRGPGAPIACVTAKFTWTSQIQSNLGKQMWNTSNCNSLLDSVTNQISLLGCGSPLTRHFRSSLLKCHHMIIRWQRQLAKNPKPYNQNSGEPLLVQLASTFGTIATTLTWFTIICIIFLLLLYVDSMTGGSTKLLHSKQGCRSKRSVSHGVV